MTVSRLFLLLFFSVSLVGCFEPGPDRTVQLAHQGLLAGDLSGDGSAAVIGSVLHGGSLWDTASGERKFDWNHQQGEYSQMRAVGVSGDGRTAVTVVDDALVVWDATKGASKGFWRAPTRVDSIAVSMDGRDAVLGLRNGQVLWFDLSTGMAKQEFRLGAEVRTVATAGKVLAAGSDDFTFSVWPVSGGEPVFSHRHANAVRAVSVSDDATLAFSSAQREDAQIWKLKGGDPITLPYRYENFTASRFSKDGKQLVLGTFQGRVYLVDTQSGAELKRWQAAPRKEYGGASSRAIVSVAFAAGGKLLVLTSDGLLQEFAP